MRMNSLVNNVKHWYLVMLVGILFIVVGAWVLKTPLASYIALSLLFAISFLVSGLFGMIVILMNKEQVSGKWWMFALNLLTFVLGLILLKYPGVSALSLALFTGLTVLFQSSGMIAFSMELKELEQGDWWAFLMLGILGIIISFFMLLNPAFAGFTIVYWTAFSFFVLGIFYIYMSLKLKKVKKAFE